MKSLSLPLRLSAVLALFLLALPAAAQDSAANAGFSEEKLDAFADAAIEVSQLMIDWRTRLQAAQNQEEQEQMIEQANLEITATIEAAEGIDVEEYETIAAAADGDAEFAQALQNRVNERLKDSQAGGL